MDAYVNTVAAYQWTSVFRAAWNALPAHIVQQWIYPYLVPSRWTSWTLNKPMFFWMTEGVRGELAKELAVRPPVLRSASLPFTPTSLTAKYSAALDRQMLCISTRVSRSPLLLFSSRGQFRGGNFLYDVVLESPCEFLHRCFQRRHVYRDSSDLQGVYPLLMSKLVPLWTEAHRQCSVMTSDFHERVREAVRSAVRLIHDQATETTTATA